MSYHIEVSDEEMKELDEVLREALDEAMVEEHRADSLSYRDYLKHHVAVIQRLLQTVRAAQAGQTV